VEDGRKEKIIRKEERITSRRMWRGKREKIFYFQ
jgi:hypothetical protein